MINTFRRINRFRGEIRFHIILFCSVFILFTVNQYILKPYLIHFFWHHYFHDLLAPILLLSYSNILLAVFNYQGRRFSSFLSIGLLVLICGLFWEYVTPLYYASSTSDPIDLAAYAGGGILYYLMITLCKIYD